MESLKLKTYDKLEEENKELRTMMRKLGHEMGNALTLLGGSIYYLENQLGGSKGEKELTNVKEDYNYLCRLFNNLREYNHFEAIGKETITLELLAESVESIVERFNEDYDLDYKCEMSEVAKNACVYADQTKMRQVMINIIKNSIEAMCDNGDKGMEILLRISLEHSPANNMIKEQMEHKDKEKLIAHIEIRDNGKGISDENISEIFKPLCTFEKKQGVGLGLAVVKKIVEDHRGTIKVVSALGTGTAMHIYLPVLA